LNLVARFEVPLNEIKARRDFIWIFDVMQSASACMTMLAEPTTIYALDAVHL